MGMTAYYNHPPSAQESISSSTICNYNLVPKGCELQVSCASWLLHSHYLPSMEGTTALSVVLSVV